MKRIRIVADEFFKECNITTLPISLNKIYEILKIKGWELRYYSHSKTIINNLDLNEYSKTHNGFTYIENSRVVIFIKDELSYLEKINVICHEIGHLVLDHTSYNNILGKSKDKNTEDILEKEADIFSLEFQAPVFMLLQKKYDTAEKIFSAGILDKDLSEIQYKELLEYKDRLKTQNIDFKRNIKLMSAFLTLSVCISIVITIIIQINKNFYNKSSFNTSAQNYQETVTQVELITEIETTQTTELAETTLQKQTTELTTSIPEPTVSVSNEPTTQVSNKPTDNSTSTQNKTIVKITQYGKKYHKPNCQYVQGKDNTTSLTIEEALKKGLTPCSKCKPQ